jgi:hypothetical protein
VDATAIAPVVGKGIAKWLGIWKRVQKAAARQYDGSKVKRGKVIVNTEYFFRYSMHTNFLFYFFHFLL